MSSRDPSYMTPEIKTKLRRKNRLMRLQRVEEVSALAVCIGHDTDRCCKRHLRKISGKTDAKELWAAVRSLTGRKQEAAVDPSVTARSLNHYINRRKLQGVFAKADISSPFGPAAAYHWT